MKNSKKPGGKINPEDIDRVVANARKTNEQRNKGYRERSLQIHPWICARCGREFTNSNLHLLTVHHKDHNHDNNPPDGSNWENLCVYCHDNEHSRYTDHAQGSMGSEKNDSSDTIKHQPFAALGDLLKKD